MRRSSLFIGGGLLLCAFWPLTLSASGPRVHITYEAPTGCPDREAFLAQVAREARAFEAATEAEPRAPRLRASIRREGKDHVGRLRVALGDGPGAERTVREHGCADVASALALMAALVLDTEIASPPPASADPGPSAPPTATPSSTAIVPDRPAATAPPPSTTSDPPAADKPPATELPATEEPPFRIDWHTAVSGIVAFGMGPNPMWLVSPALGGRGRVLGGRWAGRAGLWLGGSDRARAGAGTAELLWVGGRIGVGPDDLRWGSWWLHPDFGVLGGALRATAFGVTAPKIAVVPWWALALGARAGGDFGRLGVEVEGGILVPFTRPTLVIENPRVEVHRTPVIAGFLSVGLRFELSAPRQ